jgi:hypothetical protein
MKASGWPFRFIFDFSWLEGSRRFARCTNVVIKSETVLVTSLQIGDISKYLPVIHIPCAGRREWLPSGRRSKSGELFVTQLSGNDAGLGRAPWEVSASNLTLCSTHDRCRVMLVGKGLSMLMNRLSVLYLCGTLTRYDWNIQAREKTCPFSRSNPPLF